MAACNTADDSKAEGEDKYFESPKSDSSAAAAASATHRQSEIDTNIMNIGTDRTVLAPGTHNFEEGERLIAQSDCLACHQVDKKLVGPSYEAVAQKYEFNDKNVDYLSRKIIEGGDGVWGDIAMNPHPDLEEEEAREMARYILSLKK